MISPDQAIIDELLSGQVDILRFSAGVRAKVLILLTRLQAELATKLMTETLTDFNKARTASLLKQATDVINAYYTRVDAVVNAAAGGAAEVAAGHVASLNVVLGAGLPSETFLARIATNALVQGAPSADWWAKQARNTAFQFAGAVRQGMAAGETNEQIVARVAGSPRKGIPGIMDVARSNARALVHSSIQAAANESRMETYRKNAKDYRAVRWLSTLDNSTCIVCGARDMQEYTLDDPPEPIGHGLAWDGGPGVIHWSCRCVAVGIAKAIELKGGGTFKVPIGQRASESGPVKGNTTFQQFLDRKGAAWQDEVLGPGRGELYRSGKLTLEQLLSLDGTRISSVEQLKARYAP